MANTQVTFKELRVILEDELTQVYVRCLSNDGSWGIDGWHHKTFPASKSTIDILNSLDVDTPIMWPLNAPPEK